MCCASTGGASKVNLASPDQVSTWLYATLKLKLPNAKQHECKRGAAKNRPPTTEDALQALAKATGHPAPRIVLEYRCVFSVCLVWCALCGMNDCHSSSVMISYSLQYADHPFMQAPSQL